MSREDSCDRLTDSHGRAVGLGVTGASVTQRTDATPRAMQGRRPQETDGAGPVVFCFFFFENRLTSARGGSSLGPGGCPMNCPLKFPVR